MKKNIYIIFLVMLMFFGIENNVKADTLYDNLSAGDVIVGNTAFRSGVWITATRAGIAGANYVLNNNDANVKIYKYINRYVWYELDEDSNPSILTTNQIAEIERTLHIYYVNNEPLVLTYDDWSNNSGVLALTSFNTKNEWLIDDDVVAIDYEYGNVTCPYGYEFYLERDMTDYFESADQDYLEVYGSSYWFMSTGSNATSADAFVNAVERNNRYYTTYKGICSDKFRLEIADNNTKSDMELIYVTISEDNPNSNKVQIDYADENRIELLMLDPVEIDDNKIDLDFHFASDNLVYMYSIATIRNSTKLDYYYLDDVDDNRLRVSIPITNFGSDHIEFVILDMMNNTYMNYVIGIGPMQLDDVNVSNVSISSEDLDNQQLIKDIQLENKNNEVRYRVSTIGELNDVTINSQTKKFIALDINFSDDIIYSDSFKLYDSTIYYPPQTTIPYMIVNKNTITVYLDASVANYTLQYNYGVFHGNIEIVIDNYDINNFASYTTNDFKPYKLRFSLNEQLEYGDDVHYLDYSFYDSVNEKVYYKNSFSLFMSDGNLKRVAHSNTSSQMIVVDVVAIIKGDYYYLADNDDIHFSELFTNLYNAYSSSTSEETIYYFFNRDKTQAEIDTITQLSSLENITLIDISNEIYGNIE